MPSKKREPKIYGVVQTDNFIDFIGFCKKTESNTPCDVDIFCDDVQIDTILANKKNNFQKRYLASNSSDFCFEYSLQDRNLKDVNCIEFKTKDGEHLQGSPFKTIQKNKPFITILANYEDGNLLDFELYKKVEKNSSSGNSICFIAIEENLEDTIFIDFILQLSQSFDELKFNIIYFNKKQKEQAEIIFEELKHKSFLTPINLEEIVKNNEIYIHNNINNNLLETIRKKAILIDNLFIIEITKGFKRYKDQDRLKLSTFCYYSFKNSIISKIFRGHKYYDRYIFLNSLKNIKQEKISKIIPKRAIGFFGFDEYMQDENFVNYLEELHKKLNNIEFVLFHFESCNIQNRKKPPFAKRVALKDVTQIATLCSLFIITPRAEIFGFYKRTFVTLPNTFVCVFRENLSYLSTYDFDLNNYQIEKLKSNHLYDKKILDKSKSNSIKYQLNLIQKTLSQPLIDKFDNSVCEIYNFQKIQSFFENEEVSKTLLEFQKLLFIK